MSFIHYLATYYTGMLVCSAYFPVHGYAEKLDNKEVEEERYQEILGEWERDLMFEENGK